MNVFFYITGTLCTTHGQEQEFKQKKMDTTTSADVQKETTKNSTARYNMNISNRSHSVGTLCTSHGQEREFKQKKMDTATSADVQKEMTKNATARCNMHISFLF